MRLTERISAGVVAALLLMLPAPESHAAEIKVLSGTGRGRPSANLSRNSSAQPGTQSRSSSTSMRR